MMCHAKNVENHATFVEGFWPEFYAHGRFMKYSMSVQRTTKTSCANDSFKLHSQGPFG